ncbi:MAG: J domain-containing protein [Rhodobacteraceae bacterium]|nr:J domain-containing protein [Paracoccaceae bacterium]
MAKGNPFDFDIRVAADKRRRGRGRRAGGADEGAHPCDHAGCDRPGEFRAPLSPDQLDRYRWFCKDHIREYNLKWNYFAGQSPEDFQRTLDADRVWGRATRPFGPRGAEAAAWPRTAAGELQGAQGEGGAESARPAAAGRRLPAAERRALDVLDAREHWTRAEIRQQYKSLVKDLHPDLNAGNRADEDRLQEVVWAWEQIRDSRNFRD